MQTRMKTRQSPHIRSGLRNITAIGLNLSASLSLAIALAATACRPVDTSISQADAFSETQAAVEYKAKACGQRPPTLLIPPDNVEEHALRLCSILIVRATCPFNEYPLLCAEMYGHIPGAPQ